MSAARPFRALPGVVLAAGAAALLAGCAGTPGDGPASPSGGPTTATGSLTVLAAASLRETFTELGQEFEESHPGVDVVFSFGGSSDLVTQLLGGARGDVLATADQASMDKAADADLVRGEPIPFAGNTLTIVVPPGNPGKVTSFADLATPGLAVVVCAPEVPCGRATRRLEDATGVALSPVSEESSVTDVLNKVVTGEADAGLAYVTDASGAGDSVEAVTVPEAAQIVNIYPIAALAEAPQPQLAEEFVDLVTGPRGQQALAGAGFAPAQ